MFVEVACFSLAEALVAQEMGAHRIELCVDYAAGGLTPSPDIIRQAREKISIPLFLMIRPRAGNFVYTPEEILTMQAAILEAKNASYEGVVFGVLNEKNEIDKSICTQLVDLSQPLACTFHRAFDETPNLSESLECIIACGFQRILTAGGKGSASENLSSLKQLNTLAAKRIIIMPGGGVRSSNIQQIRKEATCREIHTAAWNKSSSRIDPDELIKILHA